MNALATPELPQFLRLIIALVIVLGLMGGLTFLLKKLGLAAQTPVIHGNKKRLRLVESLPLDARRRLVLLECDKTQHLVILSASSETVIETDIPARPSVDESIKADDAS